MGVRMAFRFKLGEPFEEGCKRIAREQIERAQSQLRDTGDQAVAVHETRKSLKRLRALLRLIRPAIGEDTFKQENDQLRQIGLSLSGARDRYVLLETVNKLEAASGFTRKGLAETLRKSLAAANGECAPVDSAAMKQAQSRLTEAKKRFARLRIGGRGFDIVGPGLEMCYRRARRAFRTAYHEQTDEAFHEWRKGAQHHWRQMTLLSRAWPGYLGARASEARNLSQVLGDDHDLAMLVAFVRSDAAAGITAEQASAIEKAVRQRQRALRDIAKPRGARLFAEGAGSLRRSVADYWEAAVALKEHEPGEDDAAQPASRRRTVARRRRPPAGSRL